GIASETEDHIRIETNQLRRGFRKLIRLSARIAILESNVFSFYVTKCFQLFDEGLDVHSVRPCKQKDANPSHTSGELLSANSERPYGSSADKPHELSSSHCISPRLRKTSDWAA